MSDPATAPDPSAIKARQQAAWAAGDYAVIGTAIVLMAEQLLEAMDVRAGWTVLDVAAGSGNASLAAARRGCRVTSTDFVPSLLERGKLRAEAEGFHIDFQVADAENLPFPDASFDAAVSTVGVMFTPHPERAAAELFRVVRPGGVVGLANWTPESFVGRMFALIGAYVPPPPGLQPPALWGSRRRLAELFPQAATIDAADRTFLFRAPSPQAWLNHFKTFYGPMQRTFAALDPTAQAALAAELLAILAQRNRSGDETLVFPSEYLEVVIHKP